MENLRKQVEEELKQELKEEIRKEMILNLPNDTEFKELNMAVKRISDQMKEN